MECEMNPISPRSPLNTLLLLGIGAIVAGSSIVGFFIVFSGRPLESSPGLTRPWAEARYQKLVAPVPSIGKPLDPQFQASHGGSRPGKNSNNFATVEIRPATTEFVPNFEIIKFDAANGFKSKSGEGNLRWLAAKVCDVPFGEGGNSDRPNLELFQADGTSMTEEGIAASGTRERDLSGWGLEQEGEFGTALKGSLVLKGFLNLQAEFQAVFDADSHVALGRNIDLYSSNSVDFYATLAIVHDAPLVAVIDLAHGETDDFDIPIMKGQAVNHPDFRLEVIDVFAGSVGFGSNDGQGSNGLIEQGYGISSSPSPADSFSVIYQINPASMALSVSVDAIDATGGVIKNQGRFMEHAPVSRFGASLASASSLRVRYRPLQTRLMMHLDSVPTVTPPNFRPKDLFDIEVPTLVFRDAFAMRRFIVESTQLKDITAARSYDTPAVFPIVLSNATPRQVAERYLALDPGRKILIDPLALTVRFEEPKPKTWMTRAIEWFKVP